MFVIVFSIVVDFFYFYFYRVFLISTCQTNVYVSIIYYVNNENLIFFKYKAITCSRRFYAYYITRETFQFWWGGGTCDLYIKQCAVSFEMSFQSTAFIIQTVTFSFVFKSIQYLRVNKTNAIASD